MPLTFSGGGRRGGGAWPRLRTPADAFTGGTLADAIAARDHAMTGITDTSEFDADPNLAVILTATDPDPDETYFFVRRAGAWANVTNVARGKRGPGPTDAQITALVAGFARATPVGTAPLTVLPAALALDTEVMAAIDALKGGVDAAYDTLDELADAIIQSGTVSGSDIVLTRRGGTTVTVDAAGLGTTETRVRQLIQAALQAAVQGNTETGIDVTYNADGTFDFVVSAGGGVTLATVLAAIFAGTGITVDRSTPDQITISTTGQTVHPTLRFGTSADAVPDASEATIVGVNGMGTIEAYAGDMYHLIFRLESEGDITSVLYSDDQSQTNQIGAFTKYAQTVDVAGDTYSAWVSNQALLQSANVTLTVA